MRESIRSIDYEITVHGFGELEEDGLSVLDLELCVLWGAVVERQRDRRTNEWKYVVQGPTATGASSAIVVKWLPSGRLAVLTVFRT